MNAVEAGVTATSAVHCRHRAISFVIFLASGTAVFLPNPFLDQSSQSIQIASFVGLCGLFSAITLSCYRSQRFNPFWKVFFSFALAALAFVLIRVIGDWPAHVLRLDPKRPEGIALAKVVYTLVSAVPVMTLVRVFEGNLDSIYVQKGKLKLVFLIGLPLFVGISALSFFLARSQGFGNEKLLRWAPYLLIFVLANGFHEELLCRGLFLQRFEPFLGRGLSNLVAALVFTLLHTQITYTPDLPEFLGVLFVLALLWGYLMQKSQALWASALFHAGADTLVVLAVFASQGAK